MRALPLSASRRAQAVRSERSLLAAGEEGDGSGGTRERREGDQYGCARAPSGGAHTCLEASRPLAARRHADWMDLDGDHRPLEALEPLGAADAIRDTLGRSGEVNDPLAREDLTRPCARAEPGSRVERCAAVSAADRDGLAGIEADADPARESFLHTRLQLDRGLQRVTRGFEHDERLVAAQLEQPAVARRDDLLHDARELGGQLGRRLVAVFLRVAGVAAHVGDQERAELRHARRLCRLFGFAISKRGVRVGDQSSRGRVPLLGRLRERAGEHRIERCELGPRVRHRRRRVVEVREHGGELAGAPVRRPAGQALVEDAAERVEIRAAVELLATGLLGRDVVDRPGERRIARETVHRGGVRRQPEVGQVRPVGLVDEDVPRLDVTVDQAAAVRRVQCVRHLGQQIERPLGRKRALRLDQVAELASVDEPHRQVDDPVGFPGGVDREDARVLEPGRNPGLAQEALAEPLVRRQLGRERLERDAPVEHELVGEVDRPGRSAADAATRSGSRRVSFQRQGRPCEEGSRGFQSLSSVRHRMIGTVPPSTLHAAPVT